VNQRLTKASIRKAAWHEAGHAILYLERIDRVTILTQGHPSFKGLWLMRTPEEKKPEGHALNDARGALLTYGECWTNAHDEVCSLVAGIAGERILSGRKSAGKIKFVDWMGGAHSDLTAAHEVIKRHNEVGKFVWDVDRMLNQAVEEAWMLLDLRRNAMAAIADALIEKGCLTYEETKKLYEEAK
jgi:ATP-dependent Zn protease